MKRPLLLCMLCIASFAFAAKPKLLEEIHGTVPGVIDGDTFTLHHDGQALNIRLEGIDAPESAQKYGKESREALKHLVHGKTVNVRKTGVDRYKRILGVVVVDKTDVCAKMVEDGWAWHFKKYNSDADLARLETEARKAKRGIWQDSAPVAPWDYRDRKKITETIAVVPVKPAPKAPAVAPPAVEPAARATHWLTTSSGIRHNSRCQHYGNTSSGRACGPNDGRACKKCGG